MRQITAGLGWRSQLLQLKLLQLKLQLKYKLSHAPWRSRSDVFMYPIDSVSNAIQPGSPVKFHTQRLSQAVQRI
jgi:hypothetical protein